MTILSEAQAVKKGRAAALTPPLPDELDAAMACARGEVSYNQLAVALKKSHSLTHLWVGAILKRAVACGMLVHRDAGKTHIPVIRKEQ